MIGAGMAGVLAAIRLRERGHDDVVVYEKGDGIGGTWRENTYPGIACDVPSHLYSYSFEPNPDWSMKYSPGAEIRAYFEGVARRRGLLPLVRFGEEIVRADFRGGRWHLLSGGGARDEVDVVVAATGVLHHPRMPEIDGLASFAGAAFHSARWDHAAPLDGRRVGVVGTGSSAVQIVSALVDRVGRLEMFQRTAQWVAPQENPAYSAREQASFRDDPALMRHVRDEMQRMFAENFADAVIDADSPQMALLDQVCRGHLAASVADPDLRAKLTPDYRAACKRLVVSPDFYRAIQQPNAELVTDRIERVEPAGVRTADGRLHELDVLVLATGFRVDRFLRPTEVVGRDGLRLDDAWERRPVAYLSVSVPGFPNLFLLNGPNGPVGNFSLIDVAEMQMDYLLQLLELLRDGECREIGASRAATAAFDEARVEAARRSVWVTGCRSWYLDDRGIPAVWPWTYARFREEMRAPRLADFDRA